MTSESTKFLIVPVSLFFIASLIPRPAIAQIAYDGIILDRANRWDGYPAHLFDGGKHRIWWCSQGAGYVDVIYYSTKTGALGPGGWSAPTQVLAHSQVPWANHHICDPSVIKGSFPYGKTVYSYALFFTADLGTSGVGTDNAIGVAFSTNGTSWVVYPTPVITTVGDPESYGAGQSGVAFDPITGSIVHAFLDTDYSPLTRLNRTTNGFTFSPTPPLATQMYAAGRSGADGQAPDIAYNTGDLHWYGAIQTSDPQGIYGGETRVIRSVNPNDLLGPW